VHLNEQIVKLCLFNQSRLKPELFADHSIAAGALLEKISKQ
jgi:hypothetical protein